MSALARWDAFLAQIEGRHREVRMEGAAAAIHTVSQLSTGGDHIPLSRALAAVDHRLHDLERKITVTWDSQVDGAISREGHGEAVRAAARQRGVALQHALEDEREELPIRVLADLARQRYKHAVAQHRRPPCSACGSSLDTRGAFRVLDLRCRCGATTVWQPSELMVSVAGIGAHPMSHEAAAREWRTLRSAERALAPAGAVEQAQLAYWRAYLKARAWFEPELARDPETELHRRMAPFYEANPSLAPIGRNSASKRP
jgi:hypothetical protein